MRRRLVFAWVLIAVSVLGWPVSALTFAASEPPTLLGLSWLSPVITALNILFTVDVRNKQDNGKGDQDGG